MGRTATAAIRRRRWRQWPNTTRAATAARPAGSGRRTPGHPSGCDPGRSWPPTHEARAPVVPMERSELRGRHLGGRLGPVDPVPTLQPLEPSEPWLGMHAMAEALENIWGFLKGGNMGGSPKPIKTTGVIKGSIFADLGVPPWLGKSSCWNIMKCWICKMPTNRGRLSRAMPWPAILELRVVVQGGYPQETPIGSADWFGWLADTCAQSSNGFHLSGGWLPALQMKQVSSNGWLRPHGFLFCSK